MGFKENLKMLRKSKGMTQKELGELINKTLLTISRYENGAIFPTQNTLKEICKVFDIEPTNLLMEVKYENKKYSIGEIKKILMYKRNQVIHGAFHEIGHTNLSTENNDKKQSNFQGKNDFSTKESLKDWINIFSKGIKEDLLDKYPNISDDDKIRIIIDLKKYYLFLISKHIYNND